VFRYKRNLASGNLRVGARSRLPLEGVGSIFSTAACAGILPCNSIIAPDKGEIYESEKPAWESPRRRETPLRGNVRLQAEPVRKDWSPNDFVKDFLEFRSPLAMGHPHVSNSPLEVLSKAGMPGSVL
jgi:hypothetical protein